VNIKLATAFTSDAGAQHAVYVGIVDEVFDASGKSLGAQLSGFFQGLPGAAGVSWKNMNFPFTIDQELNDTNHNDKADPGETTVTTTNGLHPGFQGNLHFSLEADQEHRDIVYVGGDVEPVAPFFPGDVNVAGTRDFSGRLFKGTLPG